MSFTWITIIFFLAMSACHGIAVHCVSWVDGTTTHIAALGGNKLHLADYQSGTIRNTTETSAPSGSTLAVGQWHGTPALLSANKSTLLRFDYSTREWVRLGDVPGKIREIHPMPDATAGALVLSGDTGAPSLINSAVWWVRWDKEFTCSRITAVKEHFRPWQLWWATPDGEPCFVAATYKSTMFAPFEHNCMFVFRWNAGNVEPRWLGSRLSRPYVDATHTDIRADGNTRMIAVEVTRDKGHGLSLYHAIGFGYEGEWRTESIPHLQRIAAFGNIVLCWGEEHGKQYTWQLTPKGKTYTLLPLLQAPPSLESITLLDAGHLAGWWDGAWHCLTLPVVNHQK